MRSKIEICSKTIILDINNFYNEMSLSKNIIYFSNLKHFMSCIVDIVDCTSREIKLICYLDKDTDITYFEELIGQYAIDDYAIFILKIEKKI
jgi:hypothetical protein